MAPADETIALRHAAGRGEEKGKTGVGRGLHENARGISDGNSTRGSGGHIDVIHSNGHGRDKAERRRGSENLGVDSIREQAQEPLRVCHFLEERLAGQESGTHPDRDVRLGGQRLKALARKLVGDEDRTHGNTVSQCRRKQKRGRLVGEHEPRFAVRSGLEFIELVDR